MKSKPLWFSCYYPTNSKNRNLPIDIIYLGEQQVSRVSSWLRSKHLNPMWQVESRIGEVLLGLFKSDDVH